MEPPYTCNREGLLPPALLVHLPLEHWVAHCMKQDARPADCLALLQYDCYILKALKLSLQSGGGF